MPHGTERRFGATDAVLLLLALGLLVAAIHSRWDSTPLRTVPTYGDELEIILIASSTCGASRQLEANLLTELVAAVSNAGERLGLKVSLTGVATDASWETGAAFLRELGAFDQVTSGRGWMNLGAIHFLHRDLAGPPVVPQILIVRRSVRLQDGLLEIGADQLVARQVGLDEIARWRDRGFPMALAAPPGGTEAVELR